MAPRETAPWGSKRTAPSLPTVPRVTPREASHSISRKKLWPVGTSTNDGRGGGEKAGEPEKRCRNGRHLTARDRLGRAEDLPGRRARADGDARAGQPLDLAEEAVAGRDVDEARPLRRRGGR
jgi:hypothetical protein